MDKKCKIKTCSLDRWDGCIWERKCPYHCICIENKFGWGLAEKQLAIRLLRNLKVVKTKK